jgi:hypothetical protein
MSLKKIDKLMPLLSRIQRLKIKFKYVDKIRKKKYYRRCNQEIK